ncbi:MULTISPECIES: SMI1/KNR4 family protein [Microcoleaceae]|uniref:SMI1/KNR4 family protein n=1 Tax=Microcoleaceae TaxID=1892252 RepID=UPI0018813C5F|nr:SMI1/KNR4 family protein [Tychonema sp. LEGE 06208]MBE9161631.1 SMI1/KNR4 family protein [Tychonema sp. LEGE 06208]
MYLDRVKQQLIELKLIRQDELVGCTPDEVMAIQQQLGISLPLAYQEFLLSMGRSAGKFLRGSDCFLNHLPQLQEWAVELLNENNFPESLADDAFIFLMHQGYQFSFFRLSEGADPPIYSYCEGTNQIDFIKSHQSFSDFLVTEVEIHAKYLMPVASK